jgi:hypothetical protein
MAKQLSLKEVRQCTLATSERMSRIRSGLATDERPTEFTAFYHRDGGIEDSVLVQGVNEILEEFRWSPLLDARFQRVADLLAGSSQIPIGEREDGKMFVLSDGPNGPEVHERVQLQKEP